MKHVLVLLGFLLLPSFALAYVSPGTPGGYVNDFAGVLTEETRTHLEETLLAYSASTTNEIAVVTVRSLEGDYIEHYAVELFEEWGIGKEKSDNGVLLLLAIEDRAVRIEVGYGLEGAIPDSVADRIIREEMIPLLKESAYGMAVSNAVARLQEAAAGEYQAKPDVGFSFTFSDTFIAVFIFVTLVVQWIASILARTKSWWLGGIVGAAVGVLVSTLFSWWVLLGGVVTVGLFLFGLFLDFVVSSTYSHSKKYNVSPPWWAGGSSGGSFGGSSGGGFGGFGGGSSGGGGASGSW